MSKPILTTEVIELRQAGWSMTRIARTFGVSKVAVHRWISKHAPELSGKQGQSPLKGLCPICLETKPLDADHCHETGRERGQICRPCNQGIGFFKDDAARMGRAVAYLCQHQKDMVA